MKRLLLLLAIISLISVSVFACSSTPTATTVTATSTKTATSTQTATATTTITAVKWKMQTSINTGTINFDSLAIPFADLVKEKSNGQIEIEVYPASALVPNTEIATSLGKGVINMSLSGPSTDAGLLTEAQVGAGLPFAWSTAREQYEFWHEYQDGAAIDMLDSAYNTINIKMLRFTTFEDNYGMMTTFPVDSLDILKTKKMRALGNMGKVVQNLGASTVNVPIPDVYMALSTGTVDGVVMGFSTLEDFKLKEVLDYVVYPPFSAGTGTALYVNLDDWNSLTPDLQNILVEAADEAYLDYLYPASLEMAEGLDAIVKAAGMENVTLPESEVDKLRDASVPVWDAVASASANNAKMMDLLKAFLDSKGESYPGK